ncbi:MAG: hypothetical protein WCP14_04825 [bacterium]
MSKKKTKIEKVATRHQFSHLEKGVTKNNTSEIVSDELKIPTQKAGPVNGLGPLVERDLKFTGILIVAFVVLIIALGVVVHYTPIANDLLLKFGIKY